MQNPIFNWNEEKNRILKKERNISFEEVVDAIINGHLIEIIPNPSANHKDQSCFIVRIIDYAYIVHYTENENEIFLKTIYPSRKYTKLFPSNRSKKYEKR